MAFATPAETWRSARHGVSPSTLDLYQRLENLLVSGGDARLSLTPRQNAYGCVPYPCPDILDFGSSTASGISGRAYDGAGRARSLLLAEAAVAGPDAAFDASVERARTRFKSLLGIDDAEIIFSPSGTDAQLQALFLVKALMGAPLITIVVGADQSGGGAVHTARGHHFSNRTSRDVDVIKGLPVASLADGVRSVEIGFCDDSGRLRTPDELDRAVAMAVEKAVGEGAKVLLQIMDSSKLGWRGPGDACVSGLAARWPGKLVVVVDACQMRLGRARLQNYLAQDCLVLATGSKYFAGPPFSGALIVPPHLASVIDRLAPQPGGLCDYSSRFDWPSRWNGLRNAFPSDPNYGQWLRWEAALEEMEAYFALPHAVRDGVLANFAARMPQIIAASNNVVLLPDRRPEPDSSDEEMQHQTLFAFVPQRDGSPLTREACVGLYHAMNRDLTILLPDNCDARDRRIAAQRCHIGQPVALHHRPGAALRISVSARLVALSAIPGPVSATPIAALTAVMEKLDWLIAHPGILEAGCS